MSDRDPLMRYRASNNVNSSRGDVSQDRVTPDRVSGQGLGHHPVQAASLDRFESMEASARQSGRDNSQRRIAADEPPRPMNNYDRAPQDGRGDPSPARSGMGANGDQFGAASPPRSSPSRGGRSSRISNDDMRRDIINAKAWWTKIAYVTCVVIAILLFIWLLASGGFYFREYVLKPCNII